MHELKTLLFGSIGTIVETSELQRRAFNQAFDENDIGWEWDTGTYRALLKQSGGRQRIEDYACERGTAVDATALHARKTEIFNRMMKEEEVLPRPGVLDVVRAAQSNGVRLGFVTSTSVQNTDAVFNALGGALSRQDFDFVGDAKMVENSKPAPDIYQVAKEILQIDPKTCLAIEDTAVSLAAATAADLNCIAFPGAYADVDEFKSGVIIERNTLSFEQLLEHMVTIK
ncbi:HAD-IA family hydrolase [uncultured Sulfitobacter sp.]|uniref:HAD-IA family hydrolase n=1 Tax=uncultured Sulfitobacter sp. TaxID=191468 RepID=UPI00261BFE66|nr:HAD-IA family hydrolase [uncultured Sulfitobacter sp.]